MNGNCTDNARDKVTSVTEDNFAGDDNCKNSTLIQVKDILIENNATDSIENLPEQTTTSPELATTESPTKSFTSEEYSKKSNDTVKQVTIDNSETSGKKSIASSEFNFSQFSTLKRKKRNSDGCKPPNVLIYSESTDVRANVIGTIKTILHPDHYTIYELNAEQLKSTFWIDNTTLLIVCGSTTPLIGSILMEYFLCGGKMLCLCSDVLNMLLPIYRTAEVRENELVQFSYDRWHKIQLMHHIFCYHPSPIKKHFSMDNDDLSQHDNSAKSYVVISKLSCFDITLPGTDSAV